MRGDAPRRRLDQRRASIGGIGDDRATSSLAWPAPRARPRAARRPAPPRVASSSVGRHHLVRPGRCARLGGVEALAGQEAAPRRARRRSPRRHRERSPPAVSPSRTSVRPNCAASAAIAMSQAGDQPDAAADGRALDPRDRSASGSRRWRCISAASRRRRPRSRLLVVAGHRAHPVEVGAGREALARAGQHHDPHRRIGGAAPSTGVA